MIMARSIFFLVKKILYWCIFLLYGYIKFTVADSITWDICPPVKTDIREGNLASIICKAKTSTEPADSDNVYRWEYRRSSSDHSSFRVLLPSDKFSYSETGDEGSIYIRSVDRVDNGQQFLCLRGPRLERRLTRCTQPTTLNVFWMHPNVSVVRISPEPPKKLALDVEVTLECDVTASDKPSFIMWFRNGARINNQAHNYHAQGSRLIIRRLDIISSGVYHCFVETLTGKMLTRNPLAVFPDDYGRFFLNPVQYVMPEDRITIRIANVTTSMTISWFKLNTFGHAQNTGKISRIPVTNRNDPDALYIDRFDSIFPHTQMNIEGQGGLKRYFYLVRVFSTIGEFEPISFIYEIVKAIMSPLDGRKNFEPPIDRLLPHFVPENSTFTQRVYLPFPDYNQSKSQIWVPMPEVTWYVNGSRIPTEFEDRNARIRVVREYNVEFRGVRRRDSGLYTVRIQNRAGMQNMTVKILVTIKPRFRNTSTVYFNGNEDTSFGLPCPYNPDDIAPAPASSFQWYKFQDKRLREDKSSSWLRIESDSLYHGGMTRPQRNTYINQTSGMLYFRQLAPDNSGTYRCQVLTNMGEDRQRMHAASGNITLYVKRKLKVCPNADRKIFLEEGIQNYITCAVTGEGMIRLQWFKKASNGKFVPISELAGKKYGNDRSNRLTIYYVTREHSGEYMLKASNSEASLNRTFLVKVGIKPKVTKMSGNTTVQENNPVWLNCVTEGDPPPVVGWLFTPLGSPTSAPITLESHGRLKRFGSKDRTTLYGNGTLYIPEALQIHAGQYQCTAGNTYFMISSKKQLRLTVKDFSSSFNEGSKSSMMKTVIIVVSCAVGYLGLIIFLSVYCTVRMQRKRQKRAVMLATFGPSPAFTNGNFRCPPGHYESVDNSNNIEYKSLLGQRPQHMSPKNVDGLDVTQPMQGPSFDCHSINSSGFSSSIPSSYGHLHTNTPANSVMESTMERICRTYQIDRNKLHYRHGVLGRGLFGMVRLAIYNEVLVLVKQLTCEDVNRQAEFTEQIKMFSKCDHDYVTKLVGVCTDGLQTDPPLMVLEYCEYNNLSDLLTYCKKRDDANSFLTEDNQLKMCLQVAQALEHFHSLGFIHGEVAARNVLVTPEYNLKLSNLGPCLDRFVGHYALNGSNILMPVRWLPPETIVHNQYSIKTDIWSFAIFVNEVFTVGDRPYPRMSDSAVLEAASAGSLRPKLAKSVPTSLLAVLEKSWTLAPELRPTAAQLVSTTRKLARDMADV